MIIYQFSIFAVRWLGNSLALSAIILWPGSEIYLASGYLTFLEAGLVLTIINALLKSLIILTTLPFLFVVLGAFTFLVNYFAIWLTAKFYGGLIAQSWIWTLIAGLIVGLVNYLVTLFLMVRSKNSPYIES